MAFAARLNRSPEHLVGIEALKLIRRLAFDESRSSGANCFHLRGAGKDSWIRLVHMPVMDGKETIRRLRDSDQPLKDIPLIALTADSMSGDNERCLGFGMSDAA